MQRRHVLAALASGLAVHAPPARAALDTAALERVAAEIDLHSLLVWQRGALLMEHYRSSRDKPIGAWFAREVQFGPDVLHDMRSISKSVVGLLVGQAIARGELALAQAVLDLFPELADLRAGPQAAITVEHLLTMSSGLAWSEEVSTYGSNANDEQRLFFDAAPARYILDRPLVAAPGALWHYNGGLTVLLAEALQRRSGRRLLDLLRDDLFAPLGIKTWTWHPGQHGQPLPYAGLRLSSPDLLRLGLVMLDGGRWQGRQVIPAAWVQTTQQARVTVGNGPAGYGYHWWCGPVMHQGRARASCAALGNGGQRLVIVPELELAVVFTAGQYNSAAIGAAQTRLQRQIVASL